MEQVRVLFVCLGNICRSPTAEAVFRDKIYKAGLQDRFYIDSAGTGDWHIGRSPDPRAQQHAAESGYDLSALIARQVSEADFPCFDYIFAMDQQNLMDLKAMQPADFGGQLSLLLDCDSSSEVREVPDPYYGGSDGFHQVIQLIEGACDSFIEELRDSRQSAS